jgi:hypothetical protein
LLKADWVIPVSSGNWKRIKNPKNPVNPVKEIKKTKTTEQSKGHVLQIFWIFRKAV